MVLANSNQIPCGMLKSRWKQKQVELDDGSLVLIRPAECVDMSKLTTFYESLSKETLYMRFFSSASNLLSNELNRISKAIENEALILVAVNLEDKQKPIIGICELIQIKDLDCAESAIIVSESWRGKHLGRKMAKILLIFARCRGINRIMGYTDVTNWKVLSLLRKSGFEYETTHHLNIIGFTLYLNLPAKNVEQD